MKNLTARARAEEAVYANRQTQEFILQAHSLRRLGEWAASEMKEENAEQIAHYAETLVKAGIAGVGSAKSVAEDLRAAGIETTDTAVEHRFDNFLEEARVKAKM